jgi:hypothetical protein
MRFGATPPSLGGFNAAEAAEAPSLVEFVVDDPAPSSRASARTASSAIDTNGVEIGRAP